MLDGTRQKRPERIPSLVRKRRDNSQLRALPVEERKTMMSLMEKPGMCSKIGVVGAVLAMITTGCVAEDDAAIDHRAPAATRLAGGAEAEDVAGAPGEDIALEDVDAETIDSAELAAAASCNIYIGTLTRSGNTLTGRGSQNGCNANSVSYLTMQRSRWFGWEDLKTVKIVGPGENYVNYNCAGTGKHEFRAIHTATTVGGTHLFQESAHHTFDCGN